MDGDFGAASRLAYDALRLNDTACHFGYFYFEQFDKKARMRAGETDECAADTFVHTQKQRTDTFALAVAFTWDLFVIGENGSCASKVYVEVAAFEALDMSCH